jgi:NitT/TauT family transport system substrate-binding protein
MMQHRKNALTRRKILKGAAFGTAAALSAPLTAFPTPAISQGPTKLNFSLSWLPEGGTNFVYVPKYKGFWEKNGLDVDISRGYGSVATAKAVANNQFPLAFCAYSAGLLSMMKGLDLRYVDCLAYDSTMGVAVPQNGAVRSPKDLEGRKVGIVPTSGEAPFFPAFLKLEKVDEAKVTKVALDTKVLEQTMISGQVDAITMFGTSSIPVFVSQKFPTKTFLYSSAGLVFYNIGVIAKPDYLEKNESLVTGFLAGLHEGVKYSLLNPDETLDIHLKAVPELKATNTGLEYARLGMGIFQLTTIAPESRDHGIGYGDVEALNKQIQTIKQYVAEPQDKLVKAEEIFTSKYIGNVTMTADQWAAVKKNNIKIAEMMGQG